MGLRADIYKAGGRTFSPGGISEVADEVTLVNVPGPSESSEEAPAALILPGLLAGTARVVPAERDMHGEYVPIRKGVGPMMGGSYVACSDSRFAEAVAGAIAESKGGVTSSRFYGAVALHDRFETAEEYAGFST